MPKVSVCIPAYDQPALLKKALESVLKQTYADYEIVVSDDTPGEQVQQVVRQLGSEKIRYVKNERSLGSPANWNRAVDIAGGELIKMLHHDDFLTSEKSLEKMVKAMEHSGASFVCCATDVWYTKADTHRINSITPKQLKRIHNDPAFLFFKNVIGAPSATLYKKDPKTTYDERMKWLVDIDFYIAYLHRHKTISFIGEPLVCTAHDVTGQVTGQVANDRTLVIREHVLLFNKLPQRNDFSSFESYFDYLFNDLKLSSFTELTSIVPEASANRAFYEKVIAGIHKNRFMKDLRKRAYGSRYNNYTFRFEQF